MGLSSHKTQILESALCIVIFLSGPVWPIHKETRQYIKKNNKKNTNV